MKPITDLKSLETSDDSLLCREILAGNTLAFNILAARYKKRLFGLGFSFFKNAEDTEDFIQDVLVKVYLSLSSFRGESKFSTWLMRIAYNTGINSIKRTKTYSSLADDFDIIDTSSGPEQEQLKKHTISAVREAVAELPEKYKICVDLFFFYDMPYADIEDVTGISLNTIKSHVFRAKKILREKLDDEKYARSLLNDMR